MSTSERAPVGANNGGKLTLADKVLVAMYRASEGTTAKIPYEELVLKAWQEFPESFSLRNYPQYPDASDIHKRLYQTLKPAGLVESLGNKTFRLTDDGIQTAEEIMDRVGSGGVDRSAGLERLSRAEAAFLRHALQSQSLSLYRQGKSETLVDYDAKQLFQFSTGAPLDARRRKVQLAQRAAAKAQALGLSGAEEVDGLVTSLITRFPRLLEEQ